MCREEGCLVLADHRWQLIQVAHQCDLHPAERRARRRTEPLQRRATMSNTSARTIEASSTISVCSDASVLVKRPGR